MCGVDFEIIESASVPSIESLFVGDVAETEHWNGMLYWFELVRWRRADPESRRVRGLEFGLFSFDSYEFLEQSVVLRVRKRWLA